MEWISREYLKEWWPWLHLWITNFRDSNREIDRLIVHSVFRCRGVRLKAVGVEVYFPTNSSPKHKIEKS